jgi:hypothetical protein
MFTDADIEMAELAEMGNMIANGVCPLCEEALDPTHPKWANEVWYHDRTLTAQDVAAMVGPVDSSGAYHVFCLEERG